MSGFSDICAVIDHGRQSIGSGSLECLAMGQELSSKTGASLNAVILGEKPSFFAEQLQSYKLSKIFLVEESSLADYAPETFVSALNQFLSRHPQDLVFLGHTYQNMDLAPRLAARLGTALLTDCVGYRTEEELIFVRQMFRNKLNADIRINSPRPWIVTVQAGTYRVDSLVPGSPDSIENVSVRLDQITISRRVLEQERMDKSRVDLSKAEVVVAVGRGIKKKENLAIIEELAQALHAEIGASRPAVDNEWLERDRQIGSSGQTISPRLYFGIGISGAIQHVVGIKNSGCIVAINSDPNAPIFNLATYGLVGDFKEIVPRLTKRLKELRSD